MIPTCCVYARTGWPKLCEQVAMLRIDKPTGDVIELPQAALASVATHGNLDTVATVANTVDPKSRGSKRKIVEAPGVEPGSEDVSERASTCVADS